MRSEFRAALSVASALLLVPTLSAPPPALARPADPAGITRLAGPTGSTLGELVFPNSGAKAAQPEFIKAVLLLHNFEYEDARAAFRRAQALDPGFALAYWGEALTHYHPLWFEKDSAAAREALTRLAPTRRERAAKAGTPREKAYLASVEDLFATTGEGPERGRTSTEDKVTRDLRYEAALRDLYDGETVGVEAAALYALALISSQQGVRDTRAYMRAASILERAYQANPNHPGVLHYLIHAYDDPIHAPLGQCAAERYSEIAADAPHAKHMPSHIWQPLGRWSDVVDANRQAWDASEKKRPSSEDRDWHALRFLHYGYLQQRRFPEARKALDLTLQDAAENPSPRLRWHVLRMRAAQIIESENWKIPLYRGPVKDIDAAAVAADLFASGLAALKNGDATAAKSFLTRMRAVQDGDGSETDDHSSAHHPSPGFATGAKSLPIAKVMEKQLKGMIAIAGDDRAAGLDLLESAAANADGMSFDYGPPNPVKPAYELLGEVHLQLGDAPKAMRAFHEALERDPRRYLSLRGLATAAAKAGQPALARQAEADMQEIEKFNAKPRRLCLRPERNQS